MAQFKVGGKVVALEDRQNYQADNGEIIRVEKDHTYTVRGIKICECGGMSLDVGFSFRPAPFVEEISECNLCGLEIKTQVWWIRSTNFIPLDELEFQQVTYTKILDEIPVCAQ